MIEPDPKRAPAQSRSLTEPELTDTLKEREAFGAGFMSDVKADLKRDPEIFSKLDEVCESLRPETLEHYQLRADTIRELLHGVSLEHALRKLNMVNFMQSVCDGNIETPVVSVRSIADDQIDEVIHGQRKGLSATISWRDLESILQEPDGIQIVLVGAGGDEIFGELRKNLGGVSYYFENLHPKEFYSIEVRDAPRAG